MRMPIAVLLALSAVAPVRGADDFFEKKIRPVLIEHCYKCHSAQTNKSRGGLVLDTREGWRVGGDTGPAIVPGEPAKSLLLRAMKHDSLKMPSEQTKLPDATIADFETWIKMGAIDPRVGGATIRKGIDYEAGRRHWAYQSVRVVSPGTINDPSWTRGPIDEYILASIESHSLKPTIDAVPHTLIRRLTFDLTGLPPTPDDVALFETDYARDPETAMKTHVDRLLASPRFGEHWARHWFDGVRFNPLTPTADYYRDWVIRAINADVPYDRFVTMQLAGDLMTDGDADDRLIATQMLCMNAREMDPVEGCVEVVGQHLLGVSINCAKCHDHKFDAYTQADYYAMAGMFTSTRFAGAKGLLKTDGVALPGKEGVFVLALQDSKVGDRGHRCR